MVYGAARTRYSQIADRILRGRLPTSATVPGRCVHTAVLHTQRVTREVGAFFALLVGTPQDRRLRLECHETRPLRGRCGCGERRVPPLTLPGDGVLCTTSSTRDAETVWRKHLQPRPDGGFRPHLGVGCLLAGQGSPGVLWCGREGCRFEVCRRDTPGLSRTRNGDSSPPFRAGWSLPPKCGEISQSARKTPAVPRYSLLRTDRPDGPRGRFVGSGPRAATRRRLFLGIPALVLVTALTLVLAVPTGRETLWRMWCEATGLVPGGAGRPADSLRRTASFCCFQSRQHWGTITRSRIRTFGDGARDAPSGTREGGCWRSANAYPELVAEAYDLPTLVVPGLQGQRSCPCLTLSTRSARSWTGTPHTSLVTIGIGGNDLGFHGFEDLRCGAAAGQQGVHGPGGRYPQADGEIRDDV